MSRPLLCLLAMCLAACSGRLREPTSKTLRILVSESAQSLEEIRDLCLAGETVESSDRMAHLCRGLDVVGVHKYRPRGEVDERVDICLYSFGTVASGTSVSLVWVPERQQENIRREALDERTTDYRIRHEHVTGQWWMQTAR